MSRLDWDREGRLARMRRHGSLPLWVDEDTSSFADETTVASLLEPLARLAREFEALSRTQQSQRSGEFKYRVRELRRAALGRADDLPDLGARAGLTTEVDALVARISEITRKALY
jgi:hypothetical protein